MARNSGDTRDWTDKLIDRLAAWLENVGESRASVAFVVCLLILSAIFRFLTGSWTTSIALVALCVLSLAFGTILALAFGREGRKQFLSRQHPDAGGIRELRWQDFELFIAQLLKLRGYEVEHVGKDEPDGGVDLIARKGGKRMAVQCKHYRHEPIPVADVRMLYGIMARDKYDKAMYVTSGRFSKPAELEFEKDDRIFLVDEHMILQWLDVVADMLPSPEREREDQSVSPALASIRRQIDGDHSFTISVPRCPSCKSVMVLGYSRRNGQRYWRCPRKRTGCAGRDLPLGKEQVHLLDPGRRS